MAKQNITILIFCWLCLLQLNATAQSARHVQPLEGVWQTIANDTFLGLYSGFEKLTFPVSGWQQTTIPHNWDRYEGIRRMKHGNRHGNAWYRHSFTAPAFRQPKQFFLYFEGVGSYATIWLNGIEVGSHAGGRTTFTFDVTRHIKPGIRNLLAVSVAHPANIQDLPWVCGGCSNEIGFSEGSQPMGIFRPVSLVVTNPVRIEPFGVHVWNDTTVNEKQATLNLSTEIRNYGNATKSIEVGQQLLDATGKTIATAKSLASIQSGQTNQAVAQIKITGHVNLWHPDNPYLYKVVTQIKENGNLLDADTLSYGIRWIRWPEEAESTKQLLVNGKPFFINGTAEYEHLMGNSHAFTPQQIAARVSQVKAAGFNAFRDAHQPHNLLYQNYWDEAGILWWPQMAAHIWYDNPAFKNNFKRLLIQWVKERRNNPSNVLWGLENESTLPEWFAKECSDIVRQLDPTASTQRKITTCNGGSGTDWDVPQNWTGTYGGNPATYDDDVQRQVLIGEYGAWRTLELHHEDEHYSSKVLSEGRMTKMMETKVRLAESAKHNTTGHFHWLLYSHENPGRAQSGEAYREVDRIGPVNYKGLFTLWGEPADVFYMYRSHYADKNKEPMVYIAMHTWPDRWTTSGIKNNIVVYSNCDEVELFNDTKSFSLGRKKKGGFGTHFRWDSANIQYNKLYAIGYVNGVAVSADSVRLHHLPEAPSLQLAKNIGSDIIHGNQNLKYLYRVNCGGPDFTDSRQHTWLADKPYSPGSKYGSKSWASDFEGINPVFASQRYHAQSTAGTAAMPLFNYYRYGLDKLQYHFEVPNGAYEVELYFSEPWYGIGGSLNARGWRLFNVAVNGDTAIRHLDIFAEAGSHKALKKTIKTKVVNGKIVISFPGIAAGQAIISAIAVAGNQAENAGFADKPIKTTWLINDVQIMGPGNAHNYKVMQWMQSGQQQYLNGTEKWAMLPPDLFGAEYLQLSLADNKEANNQTAKITTGHKADIWLGIPYRDKPEQYRIDSFTETKTFASNNEANNWWIYKRTIEKGTTIEIPVMINGQACLVAATPASIIDPAFDLKQSISYRYDQVINKSNTITTDSILGRKGLTFQKPQGDTIVWQISVGVADVYAMRIRYANTTEEDFEVEMILQAADGTVMKRETLRFEPYLKNKWGLFHTSTGTSINAGNYTVTLISKNAKGLILSTLEIQ